MEADVDILTIKVGYYERFESVLRRLEKLAGWSTTLRIGEDVSQGDMVGCASPGWSEKYAIAQKQIARSCTQEKRFILRQIEQSRPAVLVFSGRSALGMFADAVPEYPWLADWAKLASGELLRLCTTSAAFVEFGEGNARFRARVLCAPHFSYLE